MCLNRVILTVVFRPTLKTKNLQGKSDSFTSHIYSVGIKLTKKIIVPVLVFNRIVSVEFLGVGKIYDEG
jgi:hypothetical protein